MEVLHFILASKTINSRNDDISAMGHGKKIKYLINKLKCNDMEFLILK